jgi:hypothetical protein
MALAQINAQNTKNKHRNLGNTCKTPHQKKKIFEEKPNCTVVESTVSLDVKGTQERQFGSVVK